MKKNDNNINGKLKFFCEKRKGLERYDDLRGPFSYGSFTYATDGRVLVRVNRQKEIPSPMPGSKLRKTAKSASRMFDKFPKKGFKRIQIPTLEKVRTNSYGQRIVAIGKRNFNLKFLTAMKRLPDMQVCPREFKTSAGFAGAKPMAFVFSGGRGLVMPTLSKARKRII